MWSFLGSVATLLITLLVEYFTGRAEARKRDEEFRVDEAKFKELAAKALARMYGKNAQDSQGAGNAWDQADKKP